MGEMSFALTYGRQLAILIEVRMPSYRVQHFDEE